MEHINFEAIKLDLANIMRAIEKAVHSDIQEFILNHHLETTNSRCFLRSDFINTNLREILPKMEMHSFHRSAWEGRILIDRVHRVTYSILTEQTLKVIPQVKDRRMPHYLQSILHVENADVRPQYEPIDLFEEKNENSLFSASQYTKDYQEIMGETLSIDNNYIHVVISYTAKQGEIVSATAQVLTPNFAIAREYSLMNLLHPDFINLTEDFAQAGKPQDVHNLVSVKPVVAKLKARKKTQKLISIKERRGKSRSHKPANPL